jgi:hypothetical protein
MQFFYFILVQIEFSIKILYVPFSDDIRYATSKQLSEFIIHLTVREFNIYLIIEYLILTEILENLTIF